tara:strand:+ start:266 stop:505 length:240 start_codon:yes stop_codon:yes gene_type:complete
MNSYEIREPIWKDNSIGVAEFRLLNDLLINISYKNKNDEKVFPETYIIKNPNLTNREYQIINGKKIYKFLIQELDVYEQ